MLELQLGVNFNVQVLPNWHETDAKHGMEAFETSIHRVESCIRRHYISKDFWTLVINEVLVCMQESENPYDMYTVGVMKEVWWLDTCSVKLQPFACSLELLQLLTVRDSCEK